MLSALLSQLVSLASPSCTVGCLPHPRQGKRPPRWLRAAVPGLSASLLPPDTACPLSQPRLSTTIPPPLSLQQQGMWPDPKAGLPSDSADCSPETHPQDTPAPHTPATAPPVPMLSVPASQTALYPSQTFLLSMILP